MPVELVTVLVPTTGRPAMLRTALESIAKQTDVARIARVIVSENAGDAASRAVSAEFSDRLAIDYIFREPLLASMEHALALADALPAHGFVAILHDDDWWTPHHLENSLRRLHQNPSAVASYASFFEVTGEASPLKCTSNFMFWFGANFPTFADCWMLDKPAVLLSCLWGTPCHYSTLFTRTSAYRQAALITYRDGNPFDNDRRLLIELARVGPILFDPMPAVFIRLHAQQDNLSFAWAERNRHFQETTHYLVNRISELPLELSSEISRRLRDCPASARPTLLSALRNSDCAGALLEWGALPQELTVLFAIPNARPNWRYYLGQMLPPVLLSAINRWRGISPS